MEMQLDGQLGAFFHPARSATPPKLPQLGRFVQPKEVADLVAVLFGPSGCSITGQRLVDCAGASL